MTPVRTTFRALRTRFRDGQFKPMIVLFVSPPLLLAWKYFGSPEYYHVLLRHWPGLVLGNNPAATAAGYHFGLCFLLLGLVPALIVKLLFRERLADYGVQWGNRVRTVRSLLLLAPVFLLLAYFGSRYPAMRAEYPINHRADASPWMFGWHAGTYLLFYLGWEFHFRGFLQAGLREKLGDANALLIQVMASSLLHIGKPGIETFAAIPGGILWGILAFRTRSLLSGLLQHSLLGIALDWFICYFDWRPS